MNLILIACGMAAALMFFMFFVLPAIDRSNRVEPRVEPGRERTPVTPAIRTRSARSVA